VVFTCFKIRARNLVSVVGPVCAARFSFFSPTSRVRHGRCQDLGVVPCPVSCSAAGWLSAARAPLFTESRVYVRRDLCAYVALPSRPHFPPCEVTRGLTSPLLCLPWPWRGCLSSLGRESSPETQLFACPVSSTCGPVNRPHLAPSLDPPSPNFVIGAMTAPRH
jgi:hypothetical protein